MRRAHLITPFGVGALCTMVNGVTVITASLDAWFHDFNGNYIEPQDMEIQDWRLHKQLHISNLRLPPRGADTVFRGNLRRGQVSTSFVPVLRFPRWNKCQFCNTLTHFPLSFSGEASCQNLDCKSKSVFQVSIVVACENGHLDDFPWRKWVHRGDIPDCGGVLKQTSTGGGTLASQWVSCTGCNAKKQNLQSILGVQTLADGSQKSNLSKKLSDSIGEYTCTGGRPWANEFESCSAYSVALLRTSSNVYFPIVESSIYIPQTNNFANPSFLVLTSTKPFKAFVFESTDFLNPPIFPTPGMSFVSGSLPRSSFLLRAPSYTESMIKLAVDSLSNGMSLIVEIYRWALTLGLTGEALGR